MDLPKFDPLQLDETDFIVDLDAQNVCFLPLPIFTRISEMLSPSDFYNLAQTCRYMHWRMFTYGHLMLKRHLIEIDNYDKEIVIREVVTIEGKPSKEGEIIVSRPYVHIEYFHLSLEIEDHFSPVFDKMIDYVSKAKKRTKHYCIEISCLNHECTQQAFQDINNFIERLNPFHLELCLVWNDHKLSVEIPNIKNIYSVGLHNLEWSAYTDFLMNPCARYFVFTVQDLRDIVQEFTKNSRLQSHFCRRGFNRNRCRAMLEKEWNLKFKKADETIKDRFYCPQPTSISLYASIPSGHGDVEILIMEEFVIVQRKETYAGQWKDFHSNVNVNNTEIICDASSLLELF